MDISSRRLTDLVFKRVIRDDMENLSLDGKSLKVLMSLNGRSELSSIARDTGLDSVTLKRIISKLLDLGLVEEAKGEVKYLDKEFTDYLLGQLAIAVGPMAEVFFEDVAEEIGVSLSAIPLNRAAELIDGLARQIPRAQRRVEFQQTMVEKIREIET